MRRLAPAKINLFLHIIGKRPDGYHNLASVMQQISIFDELEFKLRPEGISLSCPGADLPVNEDNLVYRAAKALFDYASYPGGVEIKLTKKIPAGAGLGGGSSDAAATLTALNELCSLNVSHDELISLGADLGADVPFFIFGARAFATGTGTVLEPVSHMPELNLVLIKPGFSLSTRDVYEGLNLALTKKKNNYSIPRFYDMDDVVRGLHNDLESVSFRMRPELMDFRQILVRAGALGVLMSGSGPTMFGIFADEKAALEAREAIFKTISSECLVLFAQSL